MMHIGLFDSGSGGLTVLKELKKTLTAVHISYLGDLARVPYGNGSPEIIKRYSYESIHFLESLGVDTLFIACHTTSCFFTETKQTKSKKKLYNMILPWGKEVLKKSKNKRVGIVATQFTVKTEVYPRVFKNLDNQTQVFINACPQLVPMIENSITQGPEMERVLKDYLRPLISEKIDSLLLACTHYPLLSKTLSKLLGPSVQLIDPAKIIAQSIKKQWEKNFNKNQGKGLGKYPHFKNSLKNRSLGGHQALMKNESHQTQITNKVTEGSISLYVTKPSLHFNQYCKLLFPDLNLKPIVCNL